MAASCLQHILVQADVLFVRTGGEDFSFYGHAGVPAAFVFLGIKNETAGAVHGVHTPQFTLDEEVLQTGAAYLASLASQYLEQHAASLSTAHQEL